MMVEPAWVALLVMVELLSSFVGEAVGVEEWSEDEDVSELC